MLLFLNAVSNFNDAFLSISRSENVADIQKSQKTIDPHQLTTRFMQETQKIRACHLLARASSQQPAANTAAISGKARIQEVHLTLSSLFRKQKDFISESISQKTCTDSHYTPEIVLSNGLLEK